MTKTATCGWCKTKGIECKPNGDLQTHNVPGKTRVACSGYSHWFAQGRSR